MPKHPHRLALSQRPTGRRRYIGRRKAAARHGVKIKVVICLTILLLLSVFAVYAYLGVYRNVLNVRLNRAYALSRTVLRQAQVPPGELERYAVAIAKNSVEKSLNPAIVSAIVLVESSGNPMTVSPSGDLGLMQVNVRIHSGAFDFEKRNLLNPEDNISVGTTILRSMLDRYGEEKAIAAYNGLLPEKHEYTSKVQAILSRAGLSPEAQRVSSNLSFLAAVSDWIEALQVVPHSQKAR